MIQEKAMAPHSSTLAWKIPWMEEPGRLQSMGSLRVGHDWVTSLSRLEKEMETHSSVLTWRIPGTGEPGGLPSMGSHRVRHDWSDLAAAWMIQLSLLFLPLYVLPVVQIRLVFDPFDRTVGGVWTFIRTRIISDHFLFVLLVAVDAQLLGSVDLLGVTNRGVLILSFLIYWFEFFWKETFSNHLLFGCTVVQFI